MMKQTWDRKDFGPELSTGQIVGMTLHSVHTGSKTIERDLK